MVKIAQRVSDKRLLKLIRTFLTAGVMEDGLVSPVDERTPQGGRLSPLLSTIVLNEFDRELERRGLHFTRRADGCDIHARSRWATACLCRLACGLVFHRSYLVPRPPRLRLRRC